ncbi:MAG: hypothetical protein NW203_05380 [Hyphomonadaceae bacterium]|nr:hypothetical protein [Hyphomonadaceae bacterium]
MARRDDILRFIGDELVRQQAPQSAAEIDRVSGAIVLRGGVGGDPRKAADRAKAAAFVWRFSRLSALAAAAVLAVALAAGAVALVGREALTAAQPLGAPLNDSVRYDGGVATLIMRTDPQGPRWSGRGGGETVSVSLLLIPFEGAAPRLTRLVQGVEANNLTLARVLGGDGATVWADAGGLFGVRLRDGALVTPDALQAANPGLEPGWWRDPRGMSVREGRLHIMRIDRSAAVSVDPQTLRAAPAEPRPGPPRLSAPAQDAFMAAGLLTAGGAWLGLQPADEGPGALRVGRWLRPVESADAANAPRFLALAALDPSADRTRYRIRAIARVGAGSFVNAGFLRSDAASEPLRLRDPAGAVLIHTRPPAHTGTLLVSRVDEAGGVAWTADTGLDRFTLRQILPGDGVSAFVGARPPEPGRLSEPLVVIVDNNTGAVTTHTLWR